MESTNYMLAFGRIAFIVVVFAIVPIIVAVKYAGNEDFSKTKRNLVIYGWPLVVCLIVCLVELPSLSTFEMIVAPFAFEFIGMMAGGLPFEYIEKKKKEKREEEDRNVERDAELYRLRNELERYKKEEGSDF